MNITFETERETDGRWIAEVPELAGVLAYGSTEMEAVDNVENLATRVLKEKLLDTISEIEKTHSEIKLQFGQGDDLLISLSFHKPDPNVRFDRLVSLSGTLRYWAKWPMTEGELILAWVNLGALLEGTLKGFLTIYSCDFERDTDKHNSVNAVHKKGTKKDSLKHPGELKPEDLINYFRLQKLLTENELEAALRIRNNRNAVHALLGNKLDPQDQFVESVEEYRSIQLNSIISFRDPDLTSPPTSPISPTS
jgi:predicted RNase H-like HicB family nuclease